MEILGNHPLMNRFRFKAFRGTRHDVERFTDLNAFFIGQFFSQLIDPAIAFFDALPDLFLAFIGEIQQFCAAIMRIFLARHQTTLDKFVHELAGGGG